MREPAKFNRFEEVLRWQAAHRPEALAFAQYRNSEVVEQVSFGELLRRAEAVASGLGGRLAGGRVLIALPNGMGLIESLLGVWLAGGVAVPAMPPRAGRRGDRMASIVRDCAPMIVITDASSAPAIVEATSACPAVPRILLAEELRSARPDASTEAALNSEPLAVLQYTSGSIGNPRGVALTHRNLLANQEQIAGSFGHDGETVVAGWLPMHHDMGLIGNVLQPLWLGRPYHFMAPEEFLIRPFRWLKLMEQAKATTSGGPNFAYDLCVTRVPASEVPSLDLSRWKVAFNGAEPVRATTIARFTKHFSPAGFQPRAIHPCYGLAEATLIVSGKAPGAPPQILRQGQGGHIRVSCGQPVDGCEIAIIDPETRQPLADGESGEVCVRSPSVARGYFGMDEDRNFNVEIEGKGSGWLRTGDLGCLVKGEVLITGRLKDIVIVGGKNHAAEDLENCVQQALGFGGDVATVAFSVDGIDAEELIIAIEVGRDSESRSEILTARVNEALGTLLEITARAVIPVPRGRLPRTTSGKVRRQETKRLYVSHLPPFGKT